ncbi:peptidase [Nitrosomonas sp. HPC101]|uniref:PepSY domain-containing protein n=1 Tax=Nitrosomonas sp. HPC101 TaxID=1658667 RepID=UPI0013683A29|nr:PepSY domain-containing protein [Nitrosomonas sp. HPC101]MXS84521.1 peptidase [Nitrosomonas sp. HPC101]
MNGWQQALLVMLIMIAAMSNTTAGRHNAASEHNKAGHSASGVISEQRAIAIAQRHFKGRVLAINRTDNLYRVKILSDRGIVHTVLINAQNGAVVSTQSSK